MDNDKTFTSEDLAAAVALAVQPLKDKITELEAKDAETETETKIAEARAELETKVSELQTELDVKVAEVEASKQELEDLKTSIEAEKTAAAEEAAREERKTTRLDEVKENASYSDEYLATHADRWASMTDDEFAGLIDDLKAAGVKKGEKSDDKLPSETKLNASSEKANKDEVKTHLGTVLDLRAAGFDARRIH